MNIDKNSFNLRETIRILKMHNALPGNIEVTPIGNDKFYLTSAFSSVDSSIITESVSTAIANSAKLSTLKSLIEYIERRALIQGKSNGLKSCSRNRSEGTAAYPSFILTDDHKSILGKENSLKQARENAYFECLERYVWKKWWENHNVGHRIITLIDEQSQDLNDINIYVKYSSLIDPIRNHTPIKSIKAIYPSFECHFEEYSPTVLILVAELENGGFIPAGAAGSIDDLESIYLRALSELYRHSIAVSRIKKQRLSPSSHYENRLYYFSSGKGDTLVNNRINNQGVENLTLPELEIDEEITHDLSNEVTVYRCLFKEMPEFINDRMDEFCI